MDSSKVSDSGDFMKEVVERYKTMNDDKKNEVLSALLKNSSFTQYYFMKAKLNGLCCEDFIAFLPREISYNILSYCDVSTLLVACLVSKEWNDIISSHEFFWQKKLTSLGLAISKVDLMCLRNRKENCKATYLRMSKMMNSMHKNTALHPVMYPYANSQVTGISESSPVAVTFWETYLIFATDHKLKIWNFVTDVIISETETPEQFKIVGMKCQEDKVVVWSPRGGSMSCHLPSLEVLQTYRNGEEVHDMSLLSSQDLLVISTLSNVAFFSLTTGHLFFVLTVGETPIYRVHLKPNLIGNDLETQGTTLVTVHRDKVTIWHIPQNSDRGLTRNCGNITGILSLPCEQSGDWSLGTPEVHFIGQNLYYLGKTRSATQSELCNYDLLQRQEIFRRTLNTKVKSLLLIGAKYFCTLSSMTFGPELRIWDVNTGQQITAMYIYPDLKFAYRCETGYQSQDWLDGFNGLNNKGVIVAMADEKSVRLTMWNPVFHCPDAAIEDNQIDDGE